MDNTIATITDLIKTVKTHDEILIEYGKLFDVHNQTFAAHTKLIQLLLGKITKLEDKIK